MNKLTTEEMLIEISSYKYKSYGFSCVFLTYTLGTWEIIWRNPHEFSNNDQTLSSTPNEACKKALEFIKNNDKLFTKKHLKNE
jgi:hypothetical protein